MPDLIAVVLGTDLLLLGCEALVPASRSFLPIGGNHPSQVGGLLILAVGVWQILEVLSR
jgi:hypothetical protein